MSIPPHVCRCASVPNLLCGLSASLLAPGSLAVQSTLQCCNEQQVQQDTLVGCNSQCYHKRKEMLSIIWKLMVLSMYCEYPEYVKWPSLWAAYVRNLYTRHIVTRFCVPSHNCGKLTQAMLTPCD
jgi:hypothetical protein